MCPTYCNANSGNRKLAGEAGQAEANISSLCVIFSTVQKSISNEFLWKLLKHCYFIEDLCEHHQIPGVN